MNKTIIAVYGRGSEGKSTTVKRVCQMLMANYAVAKPNVTYIDYAGDILLTIQIGNVKIGIESQGDPNSRMFKTIEDLAKVEQCDIIVCTTRTRSETVHEVDRIADLYSYHTIWISSFYTPSLNHNVLNHQAAINAVNIIDLLIGGIL